MAMWNKALKEWATLVVNYIVIQGKMGWSNTVPRGKNSMTPWNRGHNGKEDEGTLSKVYDLIDSTIKHKGSTLEDFCKFQNLIDFY